MKKLAVLATTLFTILTFSACDSANPAEDGGFPITKHEPDQRRVDTTGRTIGVVPFGGQSAGKVTAHQQAALMLEQVAFVAKPEDRHPNTGAASSSLNGDVLTVVYNTAGNNRDGSITTIDVSDPSNPVLIADYRQSGNIEFADVVIVDHKANVVGQKSSGAFYANVEDEVMLDLPSSTAIGVDASGGKIAAVTGSQGSLTFIDSAYDTTRIVEGEPAAFLGIDFDETGIAVTDARGMIRLFNEDGELLTTTLLLPGPLRTNERSEIDREVFGNNSYYAVGAHLHGGIILDVDGNTVLSVEGFGLGVDLDDAGVAFSLADRERQVEGKVVLGLGDPVAGYTLYELTGLPYANSVQFDDDVLYVSTHEGTHIIKLEEE